MVTCIINQLDCSAGMRAVVFCISWGKVKLANALVRNDIGEVITPMKSALLILSRIRCETVKPQDKKSSDSNRLLRGKCPDASHLNTSNPVKERFAAATPKVPTGLREELKEKIVFAQYQMTITSRHANEKLPRMYSKSEDIIIYYKAFVFGGTKSNP